ncbi:Multicopper oxidase type 2, partial [Penicillium maclennaniae]|uniref:Multicopper oxidase type 2 n=1 Tax=Penicillium maclennaniae TaxID=1343394 RepID=UPI00253F73A1
TSDDAFGTPLKTILALAASSLVPLAWAKKVHFDLNLTWQKGAPDGNAREIIFMNDLFPGPELRITQGDDVEGRLFGLHLFITQDPFQQDLPIEPGRSWTYRWKATQYGTYWYHAHARLEMADGLYGAIWINPAPETLDPLLQISTDPTDIATMKKAEKNLHLFILSDWDHLTAAEYQQAQRDSGLNLACMDSVLINGRGAVYCPGTNNISSVELPYLKTAIGNQPLTDKGVNQSPEIHSIQRLTFSLHRCLPNIYQTQGDFPPTIEANVPKGLNAGCKPTTGLHEIINVNADHGWVSLKFISAAFMKSLMFSIDEHPMYIYKVDGSYIEPQLAESVAIFSGERYAAMVKLDKPYKDYTIRGSDNIYPSQPFVDYEGRSTSAAVKALDQRNMKPYPPVTVPRHADQLTKNGTWVDLLLQLGDMSHTPPIQATHVMHKHSNKGFILGAGRDFFIWTSTEEANAERPELFQLDNPLKRDTLLQMDPPARLG